MITLAETICELSREHCRAGGLIMGQNLEAVQSVCGTVPIDEPGVVIMPTCEAAGIGMAIGAALSGVPVIHVIRFASFLLLQSSPICFYAARAKNQWQYDLPLFIRVSSDDGIGPTHSGMYHSLFLHMPGLKVTAPMTPVEYLQVWREFQATRQPVLVSEHRRSYANASSECLYSIGVNPSVVILAVSAARLDAEQAMRSLYEQRIAAELFHVWRLNDRLSEVVLSRVEQVRRVLIVGCEYETHGLLEHIGYEILRRSHFRINIKILGMKEPPGVYQTVSRAEQISDACLELTGSRKGEKT